MDEYKNILKLVDETLESLNMSIEYYRRNKEVWEKENEELRAENTDLHNKINELIKEYSINE